METLLAVERAEPATPSLRRVEAVPCFLRVCDHLVREINAGDGFRVLVKLLKS